jgi:lipoprotein-anchoring transpeptidase ErfK/SrfK
MRKQAVSAAVAALFIMSAPALSARELVSVDMNVQPGTILVRTGERRLYYVVRSGSAIRYPVAVGKPGKQWYGETRVLGKYVNPAWSPPLEVKRDNPKLPDLIPGGSPRNPMGVRALTLGDEYAIHGTNKPGSIGTYASYGCIRMHNRDIVDLFERVMVGTRVLVTR